MDFDTAFEAFIHRHLKSRTGDSAERIKSGLQHAEKMFVEQVWWPAFENFDSLYPEYEIRDFKEGIRYIDFAYIKPHFRVAIEIDGFGSHWKDITPEQFTDHCTRQNHLVIDRWDVLRFSYAAVRDEPRMCQQTIQQLIGRLTGETFGVGRELSVTDRDMIKLAMAQIRPITTTDIMKQLNLSRPTAFRHLKRLVQTGWLVPTENRIRVRGYRLHPSKASVRL